MDFLASLNTLSNGQLLFIGLLIFAAVLIFPHLIRRKNIQRCILEKNKKGEMILIGKFGILLLNCFGFGGHIYLEESQRRFMQNMNDTIKEIPNPVRAMDQNMDLTRLFLKGFDFSPIPVYSASVFTRQNVILSVPNDIRVFTRSDLMHWLETEPCFKEDNEVPVRMLANYFTESIKTARK